VLQKGGRNGDDLIAEVRSLMAAHAAGAGPA